MRATSGTVWRGLKATPPRGERGRPLEPNRSGITRTAGGKAGGFQAPDVRGRGVTGSPGGGRTHADSGGGA